MDNLFTACAVCLSTSKIYPIPPHWLDTLSLTVESAYACPLCRAALRRAAHTVRWVQRSQRTLETLKSTGQLNAENLNKTNQGSQPYAFTTHHRAPNHYDYEYNEDVDVKTEPKDEMDDSADALSDRSYTETTQNIARKDKCQSTMDTWNGVWSDEIQEEECQIKDDNMRNTFSDDSDTIPIQELKRKAKDKFKGTTKRKKLQKDMETKREYSKMELTKLRVKEWRSKRKNKTGISEYKRQRLEMDALLEKCFKITQLTLAEMKEEVLKCAASTSYKISYYKCDICFRGFSESSVYERHKLRHTPMMGGEKCEVCHWYVRQPKRHRLDRHAFRFRCRKCDVLIQNRTAAINHARHHEGKTFVCDKCGKVSMHRSTHLSHLRIQHPTEHTCTLCGFSFINERGVTVHKSRVHPGADTSIPEDGPACVECDIKFKSHEALTIHEKVSPRHGEVRARNDPCRFPGVDEKRIRNTNWPPKRRPRDDDQTVFICEHCGKPIMGVQNYKSHVTSQHPNQAGAAPPPQRLCTICGKTYKTLSLLRIHIDSHNPRYECDICHHKFTVARSLAVHMNLHTKDHEYPCHVCGKVFNNSGNRRRHALTVHSEAKLQCSFCEKLFKSKAERGAHVQHVHLKVPYPKRNRRTRTPRAAAGEGE